MEQSEYRVPLNLQNTFISQNRDWRWCFTQGNSTDNVVRASQVKILLTQLRFTSSAYYLFFTNVLDWISSNKDSGKNVHNQIILGLPFTSKKG